MEWKEQKLSMWNTHEKYKQHEMSEIEMVLRWNLP